MKKGLRRRRERCSRRLGTGGRLAPQSLARGALHNNSTNKRQQQDSQHAQTQGQSTRRAPCLPRCTKADSLVCVVPPNSLSGNHWATGQVWVVGLLFFLPSFCVSSTA